MANDTKKREKEVMKRRRKAKAAAQKKNQRIGFSEQALIRRAREFPIKECLISDSWKKQGEDGLVQIVVTRQQAEDSLIIGVYLIDMYCLGLKDTYCWGRVPLADYRKDIVATINSTTRLQQCPPELAHQVIYQGIDYAAQFGFNPHRDFKMSQNVLEKRGALPEPHQLTFGHEGKPLFIQGPHDNVKAIMSKLEKTAGPGNFNYQVFVGEPPPPDFFDDFEDEEDGDDEE